MILVMKPSAMPFSSSTPVTRKLTVSSLLGMSIENGVGKLTICNEEIIEL